MRHTTSLGVYALLFQLSLLFHCAFANTEKTIFLAPEAIALPEHGPSLDSLHLQRLSHESSQLRIAQPVVFTNASYPKGHSSWYLLSELDAYARYELRVCWAATQPTTWEIEVHTLDEVFGSPELIKDLEAFSTARIASRDPPSPPVGAQKSPQSLLLLRTWAAADYFSSDDRLMAKPHPVYADIILDRYAFNALPQTLISTVCYVIIIAVLAWFASGWITNWIMAPLTAGKSRTD